MAKGIKTGGRQKGTSNKLSGTVKEMITQFVTDELQHLPTLLNKLEPKEKIDLLLKLLPYTTPKIAPVDAPIEKSPQERREFLKRMMNMKMPEQPKYI